MTINGETWVKKNEYPEDVEYVLVRSRDAGVHFGICAASSNSSVKLKNARRLWRWRGANTLNEVALHGVDSAQKSSYTRVSEMVDSIEIFNQCEIIPMTIVAYKRCSEAGWAK